jgi:SP family myo-inositol transporter-like MFS transporter 13
VHSDNEVEYEIRALKESVEAEMEAEGSSGNISYADVWKTKTIRRRLIAGVGLQVFRQFVGITAVMHYSPTLVQLAGIASNETAILISLMTSGLNAFAAIISTYFIVNRTGRKKLLIISLCGVILSLGLLSVILHDTSTHSPSLMPTVTSQFKNYTCPDYSSAVNANGWNCMKCLKASSPSCGFCASNTNKVNADFLTYPSKMHIT